MMFTVQGRTTSNGEMNNTSLQYETLRTEGKTVRGGDRVTLSISGVKDYRYYASS